VIVILFSVGLLTNLKANAQDNQFLLDPSLLHSWRECLNLSNQIDFYPGFKLQEIPVLFYRPGVQEVLLNFPHKPDSFKELEYNTLPEEMDKAFYRNNKTLIPYDDQNTSIEIEGVQVLVVADPWSRLRSQIRSQYTNDNMDSFNQWLQEWKFIPDPYSEIQLILHEAFHVFQAKMAAHKYANELIASDYPVLNPVNNALYELESKILADILRANDPKHKRSKLLQFVSVRDYRQSLLEPDIVEYENLNEYYEGTAKYMELKLFSDTSYLFPEPETRKLNGFKGHGTHLHMLFEEEIEEMLKISSGSDNRFGNQYSSGIMRLRLYAIGACQAIILDEYYPNWKNEIFNDSIYLFDLLKTAFNFDETEKAYGLEQARKEYQYNSILSRKNELENRESIELQSLLKSIIEADNGLITIDYSKAGEKLRLAFTPFGVTRIDKNRKIYNMVPISIGFEDGSILKMKVAEPVLIDTENKKIQFVADPSDIIPVISKKIENKTFSLKGSELNVSKRKKSILIDFNHEN